MPIFLEPHLVLFYMANPVYSLVLPACYTGMKKLVHFYSLASYFLGSVSWEDP